MIGSPDPQKLEENLNCAGTKARDRGPWDRGPGTKPGGRGPRPYGGREIDAEKSQKEKAAITTYAINELGFTPQEINNVIDYRVLLGLRDGMLYRKQVAASKKKPTQKAASRVARPGTSNKPKTMTAAKKAQAKLAKSGKVQDAAKVFEQFI